jgi:hypothetical protein
MAAPGSLNVVAPPAEEAERSFRSPGAAVKLAHGAHEHAPVDMIETVAADAFAAGTSPMQAVIPTTSVTRTSPGLI